MTVLVKGGSVTREGGHVDFAVRLHGDGDRFLHTAKEARARETQVMVRQGVADLDPGHTVEVYEMAA